MAKAEKSEKTKIPASYKIDPDLYAQSVEKCHKESIATKKRVTLSSKIEQLIREWVAVK